jgi:hypothetical protein
VGEAAADRTALIYSVVGCEGIVDMRERRERAQNALGVTCSADAADSLLTNSARDTPPAYFGHKPLGFHCISGVIHGLDES